MVTEPAGKLCQRGSFQVAQVRQSLFEDRLLVGSVLERPAVRTFERRLRGIVAGWRERGSTRIGGGPRR